MPTEDRSYHIERARIELDRAYRSDTHEAARAHFGLASLHMKRVREGGSGHLEQRPESLADTLGATIP